MAKRILIVDDAAFMRMMIKDILTKNGYEIAAEAENGKVIFGEYATTDLGRCMIGKIDPETRGYQVWVNEVYDCKGNKLSVPLLGTQ